MGLFSLVLYGGYGSSMTCVCIVSFLKSSCTCRVWCFILRLLSFCCFVFLLFASAFVMFCFTMVIRRFLLVPIESWFFLFVIYFAICSADFYLRLLLLFAAAVFSSVVPVLFFLLGGLLLQANDF